jgi:hypothetical protein
MNIKIGINTNKNFFKFSLPILIPSLIDAGILKDDIHIFNAGYKEYWYELIDGMHWHFLDHNSIDYNSMVTICEKKIEAEYWFLIHDTCKVGLKFKELLYNIPQEKPEKIALKSCPSMNIGTYKYTYLLSLKEQIMKVKNNNYSEESLNHWKQWGVPNEDYILWMHSPQPAIYNGNPNWIVIDYDNWYGSTTVRRTEYYPSLDLYKNKSNWGQTTEMIKKI